MAVFRPFTRLRLSYKSFVSEHTRQIRTGLSVGQQPNEKTESSDSKK